MWLVMWLVCVVGVSGLNVLVAMSHAQCIHSCMCIQQACGVYSNIVIHVSFK